MSVNRIRRFANGTTEGAAAPAGYSGNFAGFGVNANTDGLEYNPAGTVYPLTRGGTVTLPATNAGTGLTDAQFPHGNDIAATIAASTTAGFQRGALRAIVKGAALAATTGNIAGLYGVYHVTSTNASGWAKGAVIAEIHDGTTTADGAFVAVLGGDAGTTTARAAFTVSRQNSAVPSQFTYGVDLGPDAVSGYNAFAYTADIRLASQQVIASFTTAITANSTTTTLPFGSIGITSNATGRGKLFMSDGTKWQYAQVS